MGGFTRVLVQQCHGGDELSNQAQRGIDVERQAVFFGVNQDVRQADARRRIADDRERGITGAETFDAAHAPVARVTELGEVAHPLAQREFERRNTRELAAQAQHFQCFVARRVHDVAPFSQSITKGDRRGCRGRNCSSLHQIPQFCYSGLGRCATVVGCAGRGAVTRVS